MASTHSVKAAGGNVELLQHILVGVCGSEWSITAFRYALELGRAASGRVEALVVE